VAGYSATPQARKLGLRTGMRVALVAVPPGWALDGPPEIVCVDRDEPADVVVAFARSVDELAKHVDRHASRIFPDGSLWVLWPRKVAGHQSDVTENGIREVVLPLGLVDVKVAAVDENWSGLKIVWRREK
jgi:Protein of unknown function (DUF3052)